jgi:hypothetical protein
MPSREREHDEICKKIKEKLEKCGFKVHRRVLIPQSLPNRNERYHLFNYGKLRDITLYTGPRFRKLPQPLRDDLRRFFCPVPKKLFRVDLLGCDEKLSSSSYFIIEVSKKGNVSKKVQKLKSIGWVDTKIVVCRDNLNEILEEIPVVSCDLFLEYLAQNCRIEKLADWIRTRSTNSEL